MRIDSTINDHKDNSLGHFFFNLPLQQLAFTHNCYLLGFPEEGDTADELTLIVVVGVGETDEVVGVEVDTELEFTTIVALLWPSAI